MKTDRRANALLRNRFVIKLLRGVVLPRLPLIAKSLYALRRHARACPQHGGNERSLRGVPPLYR